MIETELSEKQRLLLWRLAVAGGGMWLSEIAGGLSNKPVRDGLIRSRLISEEKREKSGPGKRTTRPIFIILEERGWAWLNDHMDLPIWKSKTASDVLQVLLGQLHAYMDCRQVALGDLLATTGRASIAPVASDRDDAMLQASTEERLSDTTIVRQQIAAAYARLASHQSNSRVRLAALRKELAGFAREDVDLALRGMLKDGEIILNRLDNPTEVTPEDESAMIKTSLGDPRHIMHMEIPAESFS